MADQLVFRSSIRINATAAKVWAILTDPKMTRKFMFGGEAISDWNVGGPLVWRIEGTEKVLKGTIVAFEPGKKLSYTIIDPDAPYPDIPGNYTTVTYDLIEDHGQTTVSVSDGDFSAVADGKERYRRTVQGWGQSLKKLKEVAETAGMIEEERQLSA
jgi:uncharacterized protein YndB with AHSA1/START domain